MNPETHRDWLEDALKTRDVRTAPADFTASVMRRLEPWPARSPLAGFWAGFWMEEGVRMGLTLAALGLAVLIDTNAVGLAIDRAVQSASPLIVGVVGLTAAAVWVSMQVDETG